VVELNLVKSEVGLLALFHAVIFYQPLF